MSLSFRTNGNFIDFVNTDATSLQVETVLMSLHNTSRCIDWSLPEDTSKISFTIDEVKYSNIPITEIDFDGTVMNSQDDFETGVTAMFTGLAGGGSGGGVESVTVTLTDEQIKGSDATEYHEILPTPGAGKAYVITQAIITSNFQTAYTDVDAANECQLVYGDWDFLASQVILGQNIFNDTYRWMIPLRAFQNLSGIKVQPDWGAEGIENLPIKFAMANNGNLTGGNVANTLSITIDYKIVDV